MKISEDKKRVWDVIATWVSILAIGAGGVFAIYQNLDTKKKERIERVLSLHEKMNESELLDHQITVEDKYQSLQNKIIPLLKNKSMASENIAKSYEAIINNEVKKSQDLRKSIMVLEGYLDGVVICVDSGLCHSETAKLLFGDFAQSFFRQYYPYFCAQRENWKDDGFGARVERFFNQNSDGKTCNR